MSAGCNVGQEIHPYAVEAMREVGIDIANQYPKGLKIYMGKVGFNYSIIVCARAEKDCPKTFPGVGTRLVWPFDDPRAEDTPPEEMLDKFREITDEIELKIKDWLEHPRLRAARRAREQRTELEALLQRPHRAHPTSAAATRHAPLLGSSKQAIRGLA